ncbi:hypothetical protein HJFPF1_00255 [Paramyrothecium foliicola]|nr:hypothetical protein HJFPF1_00255 [Paramyrothecium foliicola]
MKKSIFSDTILYSLLPLALGLPHDSTIQGSAGDTRPDQLIHDRSISIAAAEQDFVAALDISKYDLSTFDSNVTDLATRLTGWEGCDVDERRLIYAGWQQSWKIMNLLYKEASAINFNEAAAVEYLGPPALNQGEQSAIQDELLMNLATIQPGYVTTPFDWRLHVRCDDPKNRCPCGSKRRVHAYTSNKDEKSGLARINFCPLYFGSQNLDDMMKFGGDKSMGEDWWTNLENYIPNKARTWIHELLHIDWVAKAKDYGSNQHVTDLVIRIATRSDDGSIKHIFTKVYNPDLVKALARFGKDTGKWVMTNSDSLTLYALARYVQKAMGNIYPHLPLSPKAPDSVSSPGGDDQTPFLISDLFSFGDDGVATVVNTGAVDDLVADSICDLDEDVPDPPVLDVNVGFAPASSFPASYINQYNTWYQGQVRAPLRTQGIAPGRAVKKGTKLRILGVGDSITVGFLSDRDGGDGNGYRLKLQENLSEDDVSFVGTESAGGSMSGNNFAAWSGKTIKYISDHVEPSLQQRPNIVLVHAGTNDMNPNLGIAKEGNDPRGAAERLGKLIDQIAEACPDATILVAMIISTCDAAQQSNTAQYQGLVPEVVQIRRAAGKKVLAVDFTTFPISSLRDCIHPTNQGYRQFGDYWYDFISQIPKDWIKTPVGADPDRPSLPGIDENGGLAQNIPAPNWGRNPVQPSSKAAVKAAAEKAGNGGQRVCKGLPVWEGTGKIALGLGKNGPWKYEKNWIQAGKVADGLRLDPRYVRQVVEKPDTLCLVKPKNWRDQIIIGSGAGVADSVFLADMNGDGLEDYMVVNPNNGAVRIWWNYGADDNWVNGWKFVAGGQIASGVPHANWATLRFPDINGDGRADYVYIGAGGALGHWLNTGSPGGQDVLFVNQGGIATGAASNISRVVFADMDGDGRDDYLIWDAQAGLTGFLNQPTRKEGVPLYINQGPAKTIADGITQDPGEIRLADLDGDGMDDYAYIDHNGAIWLWYNRGKVDTSMAIDGLRFADIDGDGLDDYVSLNLDTGAPVVYLNKGPSDNDGLGWSWSPLNGARPIASGAGAAHKVQFGDIDGDGKDDYLVVDPKSGELTAYLNEGPDSSRPEGWRWKPIGSIASGLGPGANVRFADIDGDGYDDYILLRPNGGTQIYRNVWETQKPPFSWKSMPDADASGIGQRPEEITFVDINGDGKADYVWTRAHDGAAWVWLNNYPNKPTWLAQPQIAGGVGVSGADVRYATLQKTGRASYIAVDRNDGAIAGWLNGCNNLGASPRSKKILIGIYEIYSGTSWERMWKVFENTAGNSVDVCNAKAVALEVATTTLNKPDYPTSIEEFTAHGVDGCVYTGTRDAPGTLSCPGISGIRCYQDPQHDERFDCGQGGGHKPVVICDW